jgi:hypothetical protein
LNIKGPTSVLVRLNGLSLLVEPEDLRFESISGLDDKITANEVKVSVASHLGDNMEWSFNKESELSVKFTFLWFLNLGIIINVYKIPLLIESHVLLPNHNVSVFIVTVS